MANGGKRPGAGRKPGVPNKATLARQERIAATGETPLDYMLCVMRDKSAKAGRRDEMAKAAAPYVHPKLASMQHTGRDGGPIEFDLSALTDDQLKALEPVLALLATIAGGARAAAGAGEGGAGAAEG